MGRYSIRGFQYCGNDREIEIAQVDSNPQAIVDALKQKRVVTRGLLKAGRRGTVPMYSGLRIVDLTQDI
jgi:hypothetical protein